MEEILHRLSVSVRSVKISPAPPHSMLMGQRLRALGPAHRFNIEDGAGASDAKNQDPTLSIARQIQHQNR